MLVVSFDLLYDFGRPRMTYIREAHGLGSGTMRRISFLDLRKPPCDSLEANL